MNISNIAKNHLATISRLFKAGDKIKDELDGCNAAIWHATTGISTEAGEILEAVMGVHLLRAYQMQSFPKSQPPASGEDRHYLHPWEGVDDAPGIDVENIKEEMGDHLFYEGALRIATGLETLPEDLEVSDDLWLADVGPLSLAHREDGGRKRVLIDLAVIHSVLAGRILDVAKRLVVYRKGFDEALKDGMTLRGRLAQHLVDDCWVMEQMAAIIGCSEEELREANIEKLETGKKARYKDGYSDAAANGRADKDGRADLVDSESDDDEQKEASE